MPTALRAPVGTIRRFDAWLRTHPRSALTIDAVLAGGMWVTAAWLRNPIPYFVAGVWTAQLVPTWIALRRRGGVHRALEDGSENEHATGTDVVDDNV